MSKSSASDVIETVVERIEDLDKASSYFVEVDDTRLILKRFFKGQGPYTRTLRATALPVGRYEVVGAEVVHRWDSKTAREELVFHQQLRRTRSPEFLVVVKRIAKAVGGRVAKWIDDEHRWLGYTITPKRGRDVDVEKLQRRFTPDAAVLFTGEDALVVVCADSFVDAIVLAYSGANIDYGSFLRELFTVVDQECEIAAIIEMRSRVIKIRTTRVPKKPARVLAALAKSGADGEEGMPASAWKQELARKELLFWWDG